MQALAQFKQSYLLGMNARPFGTDSNHAYEAGKRDGYIAALTDAVKVLTDTLTQSKLKDDDL